MNSFREHARRVETERRAVWFDTDWPSLGWRGGGEQRGQGVRADECLAILQRGLRGRDGERCGVV